MGSTNSKAKEYALQTIADFSATENGKKLEKYFDTIPETDEEKTELVDNYSFAFTAQATAFRPIGCRLYPDDYTRLIEKDRKEYARKRLGIGFESVK